MTTHPEPVTIDVAQQRHQAHALLDWLQPNQLFAVRALLETMLDPLGRKFALAPTDDEPETEKERVEAAQALESLKRHGGIPMEEVLADFGLTLEEFRKMGETPLPPESTDHGEEDHLVR